MCYTSEKVPAAHEQSEATDLAHRPKKAEIHMSDIHPQHAPHMMVLLKKDTTHDGFTFLSNLHL